MPFVKADVVGVLADRAVDDGEEVAANALVCLIESMKVMFSLYAPCAGRVRYLIDLGEIVGQNEPVFEVIE